MLVRVLSFFFVRVLYLDRFFSPHVILTVASSSLISFLYLML